MIMKHLVLRRVEFEDLRILSRNSLTFFSILDLEYKDEMKIC